MVVVVVVVRNRTAESARRIGLNKSEEKGSG
jgi:hypothetical protein